MDNNDNSFSKGNGLKRKTSGVVIAALLIFGMVTAVGTVSFQHAYAASSIVTSSTQFFGPSLLRVLVTDTSKTSTSDTITPHIEARRGSSVLGSADPVINNIGTSGSFEFFITTSQGTATGLWPANPSATAANTPAASHGPYVIRFNPSPTPAETITQGTGTPAPTSSPLQDGDSFVITYGGQTVTVAFSKSNAVAGTDRTVAGDGNKIVVTLTDQDANVDPTAINTFPVSASFFSATVSGTSVIPTLAGAYFKETGQNTGVFELVTTVGGTGQIGTGVSSPGNEALQVGSGTALPLPQSVTFRITDADQYATVAGATPGTTYKTSTGGIAVPVVSSITSSAAVTLQNVDGQMSITAPVTVANGIQLQINDADRNLDTKSRDTMTGVVYVTVAGVGTGTTSPTYTITGPTVTTTPGAGSGTVTETQTLYFLTDPGTVTGTVTPSGAGAGVTVGATAVSITGTGTTRTATITIPFTTTGAVTGASLGTMTVALSGVTAPDALALVAPTNPATISGATGGAAIAAGTMSAAVTVSSTGNVFTNVPLKETDLNSAVFVPDTTNNKIPITLAAAGADSVTSGTIALSAATISGDPDITVYYIDVAAQPSGVKIFKQVVHLQHSAGTLTSPQSQVGVTDKFALTLNAPDLNQDPNTVDSFTVTFPAGASSTTQQTFVNGFGGMTFKVRGSAVTLSQALILTFIETGPNTGVFTASNIDMSIVNAAAANTAGVGSIKDGDLVEFKFYANEQNPVATSTASFTVGKPSVGISVDRTTIPLPRNPTTPTIAPAPAPTDDTKLTVTIVDPSLNTNPSSVDTFTLAGTAITITKADGTTPVGVIGGLGSKVFTETGPSTGVFTATYDLTSTGTTMSNTDMNNAKVKFTYTSGSTTTSASVTLKAYDATVTADSTVVQNGMNITITVTDLNADRDPSTIEQVPITIQGKSDDMTLVTISDLKETGPDTGIFTKKITVGKDFKIGDISAGANKFATSVAIHYNNLLASDASANVDRELDLRVATSTGTISTTPDVVGPGSTVYIMVNDPDLNTNPTGKVTTDPSNEYLRITSNRTNSNTLTTAVGEETAPNSNIFKTKLTLSPITTLATPPSPLFAGATKEITGFVLPGDVISIRYTDQKDASGSKSVVSKNIQVMSFDPVMQVNNNGSISAGDAVKVTVSDPDANVDSQAVDTITLRVTSSSDPVGVTVSALETGPNTGVFTALVPTTTGVSTGSVSVKTGDTLTVKYTDKYPADYSARVRQVVDPSKDFFLNVQIGASNTGVLTTTPGQASATDLTGHTVNQIQANQQVILTSTIHNNQASATPFVAIIEVMNSNSEVVKIGLSSGTLPANGDSTVGSDFTGDSAGQYTVKIFVLSSLGSPNILATPSSTTINVS